MSVSVIREERAPKAGLGSFFQSQSFRKKTIEKQFELEEKSLTQHHKKDEQLHPAELALAKFVPATLASWLEHHRCWVSRGDQREITHTSYEGGSYHIPDNLLWDFMKMLAAEYQRGAGKSKINELLNPARMRFYLDIDLRLKKNEFLPKAFLKRLIGDCVQKKVMSQFFPFGNHEVVVNYACADKHVDSPDYASYSNYPGHYYRHGIHLNWPTLYVTLVQAKLLAAQIRYQLELDFFSDPEHGDLCWDKITDQVDLAPLHEKGGLRMLFQSKMETCTYCTKTSAKNVVCRMCANHGKIEVGRVYTPFMVLKDDGLDNEEELAELQVNPAYALTQTCVRLPLVAPLRQDFHVPDDTKPIEMEHEEFSHSATDLMEEQMSIATKDPLNYEDTKRFFLLAKSLSYDLGREKTRCAISSKFVALMNKRDKSSMDKKRKREQDKNAKVLGPLAKSQTLTESPELLQVWKEVAKKGEGLRQVDCNVDTRVALEHFIRALYPKWSGLQIAKVLSNCNEGSKWISVFLQRSRGIQRSEHYCMNKEGFHTSAIIWFYINQHGVVYQKCLCRKQTARHHGMCDRYRQRVGNLPLDLYTSLLGDKDTGSYAPPPLSSDPSSHATSASASSATADLHYMEKCIPRDFSIEQRSEFMDYVTSQIDVWCSFRLDLQQSDLSAFEHQKKVRMKELSDDAIKKLKFKAQYEQPTADVSMNAGPSKGVHGRNSVLVVPLPKKKAAKYYVTEAQNEEQEEYEKIQATSLYADNDEFGEV